jgi:hypothetical protein
MTGDAIVSWQARAKLSHSDTDVDAISQILFEASRRAELLADNSKDVFEPDSRPRTDSLVELRVLLDGALAHAS